MEPGSLSRRDLQPPGRQERQDSSLPGNLSALSGLAVQTTRHIVICLSFILALLGLSGCGGSQIGENKLVTQKQRVGPLTIALAAPERPALLAEQELTIELTDRAGQPVDGAKVWLALIMPTMRHSPNEPDAVAAGPGRYKASALFTMAGNWDVEVHATVRGQEYVATFHAPVI